MIPHAIPYKTNPTIINKCKFHNSHSDSFGRLFLKAEMHLSLLRDGSSYVLNNMNAAHYMHYMHTVCVCSVRVDLEEPYADR